MAKKKKNNRGKFIVFEGLDGAGTTTQSNLLAEHLEEQHWPVCVTSEPTQGPMGFILRLLISNRLILQNKEMDMEILSNSSIALLFAADRLDHLQHMILPKLQEGIIVICDRYYLSSYAYQMGNDRQNLEWLKVINSRCIHPDLTIFLDTSLPICDRRRSKNRWYQDLYEKPHILAQVAKNYQCAIEQEKKDNIAIEVIDGNPPEKVVFGEILATIKRTFPEMFPDDLPLFSTEPNC